MNETAAIAKIGLKCCRFDCGYARFGPMFVAKGVDCVGCCGRCKLGLVWEGLSADCLFVAVSGADWKEDCWVGGGVILGVRFAIGACL